MPAVFRLVDNLFGLVCFPWQIDSTSVIVLNHAKTPAMMTSLGGVEQHARSGVGARFGSHLGTRRTFWADVKESAHFLDGVSAALFGIGQQCSRVCLWLNQPEGGKEAGSVFSSPDPPALSRSRARCAVRTAQRAKKPGAELPQAHLASEKS